MGQTTFTGPVVSQNGFIENSFTTAQLLALPNPTEGLLVYNTTLNEYQVYNGSSFQPAFGPTPPSAIPVVSSVSPSSIATTGGSFDIYGSNFTGATTVNLGGLPAASFFVVNDGWIQCFSSPHPAGTVSVEVTNASGTNAPNSLLTYATVTLPQIVNVNNLGAYAYGTSIAEVIVDLDGTYASSITQVTVQGMAVGFNVYGPSQVVITSIPSGSYGSAPIIVYTNAGASSPWTNFSLTDVPVITQVSPTSASSSGGATVSMWGYGFTNTNNIQFLPGGGSITANIPNVYTDSYLTVPVPANGTTGATQLRGVNTLTLTGPWATGLFTYTAALPVISGVGNNGGSVNGGSTQVNIFGNGFTGTTSVTFQGNPASYNEYGDGFIQVTNIPAGTVGSGNIVITTGVGSSAPFTSWNYVDAPVITNVTPNSGATSGGTIVYLDGYGFNCGRAGMDYVKFANAAVSYSLYDNIPSDIQAITTTASHSIAETVNVAAGSVVTGGYGPDAVGAFSYVASIQTPFYYDQGGTWYTVAGLYYEEYAPGSYQLRADPTLWYSSAGFNNLILMPSGFSGTLMPNNTGVPVPYTALSGWSNAGPYYYCQVAIGGSLGSTVNIGFISG